MTETAPRLKRARASLARLQAVRDGLLIVIGQLAIAIAAAVQEVAAAEQDAAQ